jgi:glucokinase
MSPAQASRSICFDIARMVRDHEPMSRAAVAHLLNRSPATVGRAVDYLLAKNALCEIGKKPKPGVGRPGRLLQFNPRINSVLTVDLRLTEAYAAVTDLDGTILATAMQRLALGDPEKSLQDLISLIHTLLGSSDQLPPLAGLVIGAPSIVDVGEGVIEWAPSLDWENVALKQRLQDEFHVPALVENDVNLAALGEFWKGAGQKVKQNIVFVSVGTGIGAGIILNRALYRGATHAAGEVAYFIADVNVLRDNAGRIGNLESRVGREGLIRTAQLVAQRYPTSRLADILSQDVNAVRTQDILALAEAGDAAAAVVYKELVDILTIVISNTAVLLDPEMIILGGPSDWNWQRLIPAIKERIGGALLRPVHLMPSVLGNNALIMGGCYSALELLPILAR